MSSAWKHRRKYVHGEPDVPAGTIPVVRGGREMARASDRIASLPQVLIDAVCDFLYVHEHVVFSTCSVAVRAQLVKPCSWRVVVFDETYGSPGHGADTATVPAPTDFLQSLRRHPARWSQVRCLKELQRRIP